MRDPESEGASFLLCPMSESALHFQPLVSLVNHDDAWLVFRHGMLLSRSRELVVGQLTLFRVSGEKFEWRARWDLGKDAPGPSVTSARTSRCRERRAGKAGTAVPGVAGSDHALFDREREGKPSRPPWLWSGAGRTGVVKQTVAPLYLLPLQSKACTSFCGCSDEPFPSWWLATRTLREREVSRKSLVTSVAFESELDERVEESALFQTAR